MKVECADDCGNAPKKALLRDVIIDFWKGGQMVGDHVTDAVVWRLVGVADYKGKEHVVDELLRSRTDEPAELIIHNIITHGNTAAANVTAIMQDGGRIEYCDVYRFSGFSKTAKIKDIATYRVSTPLPR